MPVRWISGTKDTGKENHRWARFEASHGEWTRRTLRLIAFIETNRLVDAMG
jgi:hypothetical protein